MFTPDYIQTGQVLNAAGFFPSKSEFVGFKLVEDRRKRQPVDYDTLPEKIAIANQEWICLLQEAQTRTTRQSQKQLANLKQPSRSVSITVTPSPTKRKRRPTAYFIADSQSETKTENESIVPPKKKGGSGPSGESGAWAKCAKCDTSS